MRQIVSYLGPLCRTNLSRQTSFAYAGNHCMVQSVPAPFHRIRVSANVVLHTTDCALVSTSSPGPSFTVHFACASLLGVGGIKKKAHVLMQENALEAHEDFFCSFFFFPHYLIFVSLLCCRQNNAWSIWGPTSFYTSRMSVHGLPVRLRGSANVLGKSCLNHDNVNCPPT